MSERHSFTISSSLPANTEQVWVHASSFRGVNRELMPLVFMTCPRCAQTITPETIKLGETAFRSWLLLFGLLPVDYDDFRLVELEMGRSFYEESELLSARVWRHRRTIAPADGGCIVTDEISFVPRIAWTAPVLGLIYRMVFHWRHHQLQRIFSTQGATIASGTLLAVALLLMLVALGAANVTIAGGSYAGVLLTALICTLIADLCCLIVFLRGGWLRWVTLLFVLPSLFVYGDLIRRAGAIFGS